MTANSPPGAEEWEPWTPQEVAERFGCCRALWGIAGGWALDLWLGRCTRAHGDIDVAIARSALSEMREQLPGHRIFAAKDGVLEPIDEAGDGVRQVWVLDPVARKWRLDLVLDPGDESLWIYRRALRINALRSHVIKNTAGGIPFLCAQVVLLFKGKDPRPKDHTDLVTTLAGLDERERNWLREALQTARPQSPWLDLPNLKHAA